MAGQFQISEEDALRARRQQNFIITGFQLRALSPKFYPPQKVRQDDTVKESTGVPPPPSFGLPVFTNLTFKPGQYQPLNGDPPLAYNGVRLDSVLMEVSMEKLIIRNEVQGFNGTVKTYVSDGDYQINVRGAITSGVSDVYPENDVKSLVQIFSVPDSIKVTSNFLSKFGGISEAQIQGIEDVVVESFSFPESEGFRDIQLFTCRMLSETPIELTVNEE